ncbi:MAG: SDR family oxidoreductase [Hyphomicrobiaceae bacterium]|nr:SDR family oxidoreductase [Hyphomicrobiaceae bacterium]
MLIEFKSKRRLVAGAARGIGHAIARAFATRAVQAVAADVLAHQLGDLAGPDPSGGSTVAHKVDVTDPASVDGLVQSMGPFDVLVYVAGGIRGQAAHPLEQLTAETFHDIVDVNLTGCFLVAKALVPAMKAKGSGRIVPISSRAGLATSLTGIHSYAAAKHALLGLVGQPAKELGPFGITVNSVAPGLMATSLDYERQWASYSEGFRNTFTEHVGMRRMGAPEDVAHAVLFLASDYASWITGQVLPVTGSPIA